MGTGGGPRQNSVAIGGGGGGVRGRGAEQRHVDDADLFDIRLSPAAPSRRARGSAVADIQRAGAAPCSAAESRAAARAEGGGALQADQQGCAAVHSGLQQPTQASTHRMLLCGPWLWSSPCNLSWSSIRVRQPGSKAQDFRLDGVSPAQSESLEVFYAKHIAGRVEDVCTGGSCTIFAYGPAGAMQEELLRNVGSGKSSTAFGHGNGVAILCLHSILRNQTTSGSCDVKLRILEVHNEEVYDLLGTMITGTRQKVADPSTAKLKVLLDLPSVGGTLVVADLAAAKSATRSDVALEKVMDAIVGGKEQVPYKLSWLTRILQGPMEDDGAHVLVILCADPHPACLPQTLSTLQLGRHWRCTDAKASTLPRQSAGEAVVQSEVRDNTEIEAQLQERDEYIEILMRDRERVLKDIRGGSGALDPDNAE
eukprot:SM000161S02423  [mRNA]  locus=s161:102806:105678:+ [translate_table: standard]